jgi:hypothetical protein
MAMSTTQQQEPFPEVQQAIYAVALSLDAFLVNGIQYGVLQQDAFEGFLDKVAGNLLRDLADLETKDLQVPANGEPRARELMAALRAKCQQLIGLLTGLRSFRTCPLQQLGSSLSQIPLLRGDCVRLIQELESCFRTPRPFYQSRPAHSTANVNDFLTDLERTFLGQWSPAR